MECMQYTVRGVPAYMDTQLRLYAHEREQSINASLLDLIAAGLGLFKRHHRNESLMELAGTWVEDPKMDEAFAEMDKVDEDMWK